MNTRSNLRVPVDAGRCRQLFLLACLFVLAATCAAYAAPAEIGKTLRVKGGVSVERADGTVQVLGSGMALHVGDVLTTGNRSYGIIEMADGSRMTLRPNTRFALQAFSVRKKKERAIFKLWRGGIRAVTGWIAKTNPQRGFQLHTPTAVAGIRGTEFDARLCEGDCAEEAAGLASAAPAQTTPVAGRISLLRGHVTAWRPDGNVRTLTKGAAVYPDETVEAGTGSRALVVFKDGSRVTVQSGSVFHIAEYKFNPEKKTGSVFFKLLRGGIRTFTGLAAKYAPKHFRVQAATAVAGVRGTGFDLLLCMENCTDQKKAPAAPAKPSPRVIGRIFKAEGELKVLRKSDRTRRLVQGDPVFEGDLLKTAADGSAIVVFKDNSRVVLQAGTRFRVKQYRYGGSARDNALYRLYQGGIRLYTGWMTKRFKKSVRIETPTAVAGVRGTGADLICRGTCSGETPADGAPPAESGGDGLFAYVWDGSIELQNESGTTVAVEGQVLFVANRRHLPVLMPKIPAFILQTPLPRPDQLDVDLQKLFSTPAAGQAKPAVYLSVWEGEVSLKSEQGPEVILGEAQTALLGAGQFRPVILKVLPPVMRDNPAPRPDTVPVDMDTLFQSQAQEGIPPGLYLSVYDGDVSIENAAGKIDVGKGESAWAAPDQSRLIRLAAQPLFLILDQFPSPVGFNEQQPLMIKVFEQPASGPQKGKGFECEIR